MSGGSSQRLLKATTIVKINKIIVKTALVIFKTRRIRKYLGLRIGTSCCIGQEIHQKRIWRRLGSLLHFWRRVWCESFYDMGSEIEWGGHVKAPGQYFEISLKARNG